MATTYTPNYHLGKQTGENDTFDMSVITDNMDTIDSAMKANENNISSIYNQNGKTFNIIDWSNFGANSDTGISYSYANDKITATGTKLTSDSYLSIAGVSSVIKTNTWYALVCVTTGSPRISARIFGFNGSTYTQLSDSTSLAYFNSGNYQSYLCRIVVGGSSGNSVDATIKPMLIEKSIYDAGFTDYQPYAMSNAELTEKKADASAVPSKLDKYVSNTSKTYTLANNTPYIITVNSYGTYGMFMAFKYSDETTPRLYEIKKSSSFDSLITVSAVADSSNISIAPVSSSTWFVSSGMKL